MRVLHVINSLNIGGAEKLLLDMLPAFNERCISTDLLVFKRVDSSLEEEFKLNNMIVYSLDVASIYNPIIILKLRSYLKRYDIVHVHLFPAQYWVALAKLLLKSPPVLITTEHSTSNRRRNYSIFKYIDKYIYSKFHLIICISQGVSDSLSKYLGLGSYKTSVVNNGVDLSRFSNAKAYSKHFFGFEDKDVLLAMIAGFRHQKDQSTLIRALKLLPSHYKLLLVGDGVNRTNCERLSRDLELQNRITFLGVRSDVPEIMKMVDLLIVSSIWEGFGLVAVEGMAAGKPILASNVSGLREVVDDPDLLFSVGDYKTLAAKIISIVLDKELYHMKSISCQKNAEKYSLDKMVSSSIKLYKEMLK